MATLLEININKVPDFVLIQDQPSFDPPAFPAWWMALQVWLSEFGLWFLEVKLPPNMPWMAIPLPSLCILFGETTSGVKHAIVGRCEGGDFFPVFNPWPEAEFAAGIEGLGFILPRDPSLPIKFGIALDKIEKLTHGFAGLDTASIRLANSNSVATEALQRRTDELGINGTSNEI